jgi:hypothetical protein
VRAERGFRFGPRRVAAFVDLYNICNTNAEQDVNTASGSAWQRPLAISRPPNGANRRAAGWVKRFEHFLENPHETT